MQKWIYKNKNKKGFTLIELVVVIAILGILSAIAIPRFGAVRTNAQDRADDATAAVVGKAAEAYYASLPAMPTTLTETHITGIKDYLDTDTGARIGLATGEGVDIVISLTDGDTSVAGPGNGSYPAD